MKELLELGAEVVKMAIHDYRKALQTGDQETIDECERFFNNETLLSLYCNYDGKVIIHWIRSRT